MTMPHMQTRRSIIGTVCAALVAVTAIGGCGAGAILGPSPTDFVGETGGCGSVFIYRRTADRSAYLTVGADHMRLGLSRQPRTFDLSIEREGLRVAIDQYPSSMHSSNYCNDVVIEPYVRPVKWKAVAGALTLTISTDSVTGDSLFQATATLENGVFEHVDGRRVTVPSATIADVTVGWYPG